MSKIILYIATSLDGYIADKNGKVDWLNNFPFTKEMEEDYKNFYDNISTVIMGANTYRQVINELSPEKWVYEGKDCFVFTKSTLKDNENVSFINGNIIKELKSIKQGAKNDIWLLGGSEIVNEILKENMIDEFIITVMPILIGEGIPLFKKANMSIDLIDCKNMGNGMVKLKYKKI